MTTDPSSSDDPDTQAISGVKSSSPASRPVRDRLLRPARTTKRSRRRAIASGLVALSLALCMFAAIFVFALVAGRSVDLPDWVARDIENRATAQLSGETIAIEAVSFGFYDDAYRPTFRLRGVEMRDTQNRPLLALPTVQGKLDKSELVQGRLALETLNFDGARLSLRRDSQGVLSLGFGETLGDVEEARSVADILTRIDGFLEDPLLRSLSDVTADDLSISFSDARSGETVAIDQGSIALSNEDTSLDLQVRFELGMGAAEAASLNISASKPKGTPAAQIKLDFSEVDAAALGQQIGALNFLTVLNAPASGFLTTSLQPDGSIDAFAGTLRIGPGTLSPAAQVEPIPFDAAQIYTRYDSSDNRLYFDEISIEAPAISVSGDGHAVLLGATAGIPQELLAQLRFSDIRFAPENVLAAPLSFDRATLDMRYTPSKLRFDIGQLVLQGEGVEIVNDGTLQVVEDGWKFALDASIAEIEKSKLLDMWPTSVSARTRDWLSQNILTGQLTNTHAALRLTPGRGWTNAVSVEFSDANVRYLKTLPPIVQAAGYISILDRRFFLSVQDGFVDVPGQGVLNVAGSNFEIPDVTLKPAMGVVDLRVDGAMVPAMALLDYPPFEFLSKAGIDVDVANGKADVDAELAFPLIRNVKLDQVEYGVSAALLDVSSSRLVEGRALEAQRLALTARDGRLSIGGAGRLDDVPLDVTWSRKLGKDSGGTSRITGTVEMSQETLDAFNVGLPPGSVQGLGEAQVEINLERGAPAQLKLTSDLDGLGLALDPVGWRKSASETGAFEAEITLGPTPSVDAISLEAPGLSASGSISLRETGGIEIATFDPIEIAGTLANGRVELVGRGKGAPAQVKVTRGRLDLRDFVSGSSSGTRRGGPIALTLDELRVTDDIVLTEFNGNFRNRNGLDGKFQGRVNGAARVRGTVAPTAQGPAFRITSPNGAGVLRSAGIFRNGRKGDMTLVLQPNGNPGQFDGRIEISGINVQDAPALAELLSAISVIGMIEQLAGQGINFTNVEADFLLQPGGVTVKRSSAVGPSMGITMEGIYQTGGARMDLQGVISPIYAVNGLFGALFSPRKGEGLFGFNYRLAGNAEDPRVSVNPLSMLTPGVFREIFRRAPPKLPE